MYPVPVINNPAAGAVESAGGAGHDFAESSDGSPSFDRISLLAAFALDGSGNSEEAAAASDI
jgi:hypothetical protein